MEFHIEEDKVLAFLIYIESHSDTVKSYERHAITLQPVIRIKNDTLGFNSKHLLVLEPKNDS